MSPTSITDNTAMISFDDLKTHNQPTNCWILVHSKVYDVSSFLEEHPGGAEIILRYAGADATAAFDEIHAPTIIEKGLSPEQYIGVIDKTTLPQQQVPPESQVQPIVNQSGSEKPPLSSMIAVHDFQEVASREYSAKAYAFYSSAATDLVSHRENLNCHRKILLRPQVLCDVANVSITRTILGQSSSAPFFVSPAAMARLAHPDGELAIARACGRQEIIHTISSNASYPLEDIVAAGAPNQPFFFQLYVNSDRQKTESLLCDAKKLGVKAVLVTVDAPVPGKREADERIAAANVSSAISGATATNDSKGGGLGRVMGKYIDPSLTWKDLSWLKRVSGLPIVLKGVQTASDARRAVQYGASGILLSNHGGRSLDTTQPAMLTLLELHKHAPEVFDKLEVYVDGGFTRGTDILKALALGATAVGIGRPFLYALSYGEDGVERLIDILKDELEVTLKLAGITDIDQAHPGMVNTAALEHLIRGEEHPWIRWQPKSKL